MICLPLHDVLISWKPLMIRLAQSQSAGVCSCRLLDRSAAITELEWHADLTCSRWLANVDTPPHLNGRVRLIQWPLMASHATEHLCFR